MKVFILGLAHGIQKTTGGCTLAQKDEYGALLRTIIGREHIEFIAEEESPGETTIASELALSLGVRFAGVDMTHDEKNAVGVPARASAAPEYVGGNPNAGFTDGCFQTPCSTLGWVIKECRHQTDVQRDEHMFSKTFAAVGTATSILFICGMLHLKEMKAKFEEVGYHVETDHLFNYTWFSPNQPST